MVTDYDCWHPDHENVDVQTVIKDFYWVMLQKPKIWLRIVIESFRRSYRS